MSRGGRAGPGGRGGGALGARSSGGARGGAGARGYPSAGRGAGRPQMGRGTGRGWRDWDKVRYFRNPRIDVGQLFTSLGNALILRSLPEYESPLSQYLPIGPSLRKLSSIGSASYASMLSNPRICIFHPTARLVASDIPRSTSHGKLFPYDKSYDRVTTRVERPLQILDRIRYNPTTSEDIVIQRVCMCSIFSPQLLTLARNLFCSSRTRTRQRCMLLITS